MDIAICRLCLTKNANLIDMFSDYDTSYRIPIVIVTHFAIEVQEEDKISKYICAGCWSKLEEFHQYYDYINSQQLSVGEGYAEFIDMKPDLKIITSEIKIEELVKTETVSLDKFSTVNSDSDVEDFDSFVDPPIRSDSNVAQESLEKEVTNRITRSRTCKGQTSTSKRKSKKVKTKIKTRKSEIETTNDEKEITEAKPKFIINRAEDHALISNYFDLKCELCSVTFDTNALLEAKKHYQEAHDRKGYIKCCNKKFFKRVFVLKHIENHRNPEKSVYYNCDKCNRKCRTKESLKNHIALHHPAIEDLIYKCNLCPKSFAKITFLKRHSTTHATEEDKIYKCNVCTKVFASIYLLRNHEKSHQNLEVICEICAKIFKNKYILKCHMREHSDNVPKIQCDECGKWYATETLVKKHKRRVHFTKGSFECDICNKITSSETALRNHKERSHTEKKLKCTLCDKMFRRPLALKEHLAVHRGHDLYTCQYCGQTFKSSANMYAHRKKVHFKEWLLEHRKHYTP